MLLDEFVEIRWHSRNKNFYVNKGYIFTKVGDEFFIKVTDLNLASHVIVHVKCDVCGHEKQLRYFVYVKNISSNKYYGCSNKCSMNKYHNTNIERYGVKYATELEEIKEKRKKTCREKYGVDYPQSLKQFVNKRKETNLKRYGTECPQNLEIFVRKKKQTCLKKYGFEYPHQNKEVSNKAQNTMIERYGEIYNKYTPKFNSNSIIYLDVLSDKLNLLIQHALNGGEKKFIRYYVDGYIEEYNICIEWNENFHNLKKFKEKDIIKEKYLVEMFNCNIIRINEKEFLGDIENQITLIINQINVIIAKIKGKYGK